MPTIIVGLVLAVIVGLIIGDMVRKKKKGQDPLGCSSCGGSCGGCAMAGSCHTGAKLKKMQEEKSA